MKKLISLLSLLLLFGISFILVRNVVDYSKAKDGDNGAANTLAEANDEDNESNKYLGIWTGENCTLEIGKKDSGYFCKIKYSDTPDEATEWSYILDEGDVKGKFVCNGGGKCESVVSSGNTEGSRTTEYSDGTCTLLTFGEKLLWIDDKDRFGDNIMFIKNA